MKKQFLVLFLLGVTIAFGQKTFTIKSKNYNQDGLIISKDGSIYSGEAKEILKKEGYLKGIVENGKFVNTWKFYKKNELKGYHFYDKEGNITYAFDKNKKLQWIEVINLVENSATEIKVNSKNEVEKLYVIDYKKDNSHENTFEYEQYINNFYDITIADYDYKSLSVVDFFKNNKGDEELILKDFDKHHELIKIRSNNNHVKEILFLGDILDKPEDADYKLEKGFNASFTSLKDKDNFKLSLLVEKSPIFEITVEGGHITKLLKTNNKAGEMLIFSTKEGYAPREHEIANKYIKIALKEITNKLK